MTLRYIEDFGWVGALDTSGALASLNWPAGTVEAPAMPLAAGGMKNWYKIASGTATKYQYGSATFNGIFVGLRIAAGTSSAFLGLNFSEANTDNLAGGSIGAFVSIDASGTVRIADAGAVVVATSAAGVVTWGTEFYIEVGNQLTTGNPITQSIEARVTVGASTTTLTAAGVSSGVNASANPAWRINGLQIDAGSGAVLLTDMYWCDNAGSSPWNTFLGEQSINTYLPTADGIVGYTPYGAGQNYQNVSIVPTNYLTNYNANVGFATTDVFPIGGNPNGWTIDTVAAVSVRSTVFSVLPGFDGGTHSSKIVNGALVSFLGSAVILPAHTPKISDYVSVNAPGTFDPWSLAALATYQFGYVSGVVNTNVAHVGQAPVLVMGTFSGAPAPPAPGPDPVLPQSLGVFRGGVGINFYGKVLFGDSFAGVIGQASFDAFTEYGQTMVGLITSPPIHANRRRLFVTRFELDIEAGVGLTEGQGSNPVWMLDWSKDGGRTWSAQQQWRSMGRIGAFTQRLRWMRLGQARQWIFRLSCTDPVRRVIIGTYIEREAGML
ncbi:MAG TPA: hypothetical protein VMV33_17115 [Rhodocyclaceae bacterium]|nr:hypothetical protein [Rhodocyclaceae bacterium]